MILTAAIARIVGSVINLVEYIIPQGLEAAGLFT